MPESKTDFKPKTDTDKTVQDLLMGAERPKELTSLEDLLRQLTPEGQKEAFRILYGDLPDTLPIFMIPIAGFWPSSSMTTSW